MMRRVVVQRWPAVPTAPNRMARMARSRSAVGVTMMALLPPSSSRAAAQAPADDFADVAAHLGRAGGGDEGNARVVDEALADGRAVADDEAEDGGVNVVGAADALGDLDGGNGGERRLAGGLPDGGIAADRGQRAVPRPDGDGEVEGGDDADDAEGVPLLHHAVLGPLGSDGEAVELAGEADGEVADVDHLLHFAFAFGEDLAGFEGDEAPEVALGVAQGVAELADDLAAFGGGDELPLLEGLPGRGGRCVRIRPPWRCGRWRGRGRQWAKGLAGVCRCPATRRRRRRGFQTAGRAS